MELELLEKFFRKQWTLLSKDPQLSKGSAALMALGKKNDRILDRVRDNSFCFACLATEDCEFCPVDWGKGKNGRHITCTDEDSPFSLWDNPDISRREKLRWAKVISTLPWRNDMFQKKAKDLHDLETLFLRRRYTFELKLAGQCKKISIDGCDARCPVFEKVVSILNNTAHQKLPTACPCQNDGESMLGLLQKARKGK